MTSAALLNRNLPAQLLNGKASRIVERLHLRVGGVPKNDTENPFGNMEASTNIASMNPVTFSISGTLKKSTNAALKGGISGAAAGIVSVLSLMWLRTVLNYQLRYGVSIGDAFRKLYSDGGVRRFYSGFEFAILQGPLAKFGSVAANDLAVELFRVFPNSAVSIALSTALGSLLGALWRVLLMPIDTCKVRVVYAFV